MQCQQVEVLNSPGRQYEWKLTDNCTVSGMQWGSFTLSWLHHLLTSTANHPSCLFDTVCLYSVVKTEQTHLIQSQYNGEKHNTKVTVLSLCPHEHSSIFKAWNVFLIPSCCAAVLHHWCLLFGSFGFEILLGIWKAYSATPTLFKVQVIFIFPKGQFVLQPAVHAYIQTKVNKWIQQQLSNQIQ